ncbi:URC4/urg3 family protein [Mycolicibacterium sp. 050158]|uniref:URC4/urg3 family protein n=1 Tax=Mycolicibacterium sp. 050158 TaxID=3090602 RepID=UPI00299E311A|nr:URC4/urg3 family protein [Mycolicibacterium sp. 050158]MDX1891775.1 URC4/urg3 family protein [Mycolicibacterium sp. 050158]
MSVGISPGQHPETADGAAAALRTTRAVRERAGYLLQRARSGESAWFDVDDAALPAAVTEVVAVTRSRYPDLNIPFHSRWRHFEAGGVDRKAELDARTSTWDPAARARAMIDLTVVSVLLDAGAGPDWHYDEESSGQRFARSEGLGVATWNAFLDGRFSSDPGVPLRVDAAGLLALTPGRLAETFQVGPGNPLVGIEGRVQLLHRLAASLADQPLTFGPLGRPGGLFDRLLAAGPAAITAHDILSELLVSLSGIWLADNQIDGRRLGDCWPHAAVPGAGLTRGWMPFHKLSQWLTYSLLEPFAWAGVRVGDLDELTALPEYRNGGLLLDTGVLRLRDPGWTREAWAVGDELVIEWRALTVALLDELAPMVRHGLGATAEEMPLARVLEGGTWAAGRVLAQRLRGGLPPLVIVSDGTVF